MNKPMADYEVQLTDEINKLLKENNELKILLEATRNESVQERVIDELRTQLKEFEGLYETFKETKKKLSELREERDKLKADLELQE